MRKISCPRLHDDSFEGRPHVEPLLVARPFRRTLIGIEGLPTVDGLHAAADAWFWRKETPRRESGEEEPEYKRRFHAPENTHPPCKRGRLPPVRPGGGGPSCRGPDAFRSIGATPVWEAPRASNRRVIGTMDPTSLHKGPSRTFRASQGSEEEASKAGRRSYPPPPKNKRTVPPAGLAPTMMSPKPSPFMSPIRSRE